MEEGKGRLLSPGFPVDGQLARASEIASADFSKWLVRVLLKKWGEDPDFAAAGPILIGSASRDELCPRSDLDVLFSGDEAAGARFVRSCQEKGIRLRSRFPESATDWTVGVDIPDILALREGRALTPESAALLVDQQKKIDGRARKERKAWLKVLRKERRSREERFDSIANVLEPNLKYGPGGLRDLDQGRQVLRLFPERFQNGEAERAGQVFAYYANLWTLIRQRLHLDGQTDLFTGPAQFDLARWFGMNHKDLMREVQRGLSRVHFYSEWVFTRAEATTAMLSKIEKVSLESPEKIFRSLEENPGILMQHRVRQRLSEVFPKNWIAKFPRERGALLEKVLKPGASDELIRAVFQSRLIDRLQPEFKPLVGLVQHDQYHRYTADVHLQQACREFQKTLKTPSRLGPLAKEVREMTPLDRRVLGLAMFFHDLMKGREG
ncbi:MAG: protein-PII uridylyltransferase, partial [Bdellovibrionaceae bacterium]|nr:protein-PII uridylyltransferase [Pseudobdellovibrionaceae bacterium]